MGLEAFKTEGPRTRTKKDDSGPQGQEVIHVLKGTDVDTSMVPDDVRVHEAVCRETMQGFDPDETKDNYVCDKCKKVSGDFETMLKVEKLEFRDTSWYRDFMAAAVEAAEEVDRKDTLDKFSLENRKEAEKKQDDSGSTGSSSSDNEESSGLMSFKS